MSYKAQLVVRASTKEGVEIIDKVKEMAGEEGLTFSDMAVELLRRSIQGEVKAAEPKREVAPAAMPTKVASSPSAVSPAMSVSAKEEDEGRAILPAEEAGPPVDPTLPPAEIVAHYVNRREEMGEGAAARILVDFFAVAGPGDGGKVKKMLQKEFTSEEFDALMKPIKASAEYAKYTERAIFGAPSPYAS